MSIFIGVGLLLYHLLQGVETLRAVILLQFPRFFINFNPTLGTREVNISI